MPHSQRRSPSLLNFRCIIALPLWLILCLATAFSAPCHAAPKGAVPLGRDAEAVHAINGNVYQILTGGWWCDGGKEGPYRFIVYSNDKAQTEHNLYLQLLASEQGHMQPRVVKTVPVIETANAHLYFEDLRLSSAGRCGTVVLEGRLQRRVGSEDRFEQLQLKAFQNGDYLATFETNVAVTPTPAPQPTRTKSRLIKLW